MRPDPRREDHAEVGLAGEDSKRPGVGQTPWPRGSRPTRCGRPRRRILDEAARRPASLRISWVTQGRRWRRMCTCALGRRVDTKALTAVTTRAMHPAAQAQMAALMATSLLALGSSSVCTRSNALPHRNQYVSDAAAVSPKSWLPIHNAHSVGRATTCATMTKIPMRGRPAGRRERPGRVDSRADPSSRCARIAACGDVRRVRGGISQW